MKNLTPEHMRCTVTISCPSVHELPGEKLLIVGAWGDAEAQARGIAMDHREQAIVIDRALLANALNK